MLFARNDGHTIAFKIHVSRLLIMPEVVNIGTY